jgi:hypothetical protein
MMDIAPAATGSPMSQHYKETALVTAQQLASMIARPIADCIKRFMLAIGCA